MWSQRRAQSGLSAIVGITALAVAICGGQPAFAEPAGPLGNVADTDASSAAARVAGAVRLITGDVVRLDSEGRIGQVVASPRPDGSRPHFAKFTVKGRGYVIPSDVAGLVGPKLDRELFDVTELAGSGLGEKTRLPVIVAMAGAGSKSSASRSELSGLGIEVTRTLSVAPAKAGWADTGTSDGVAKTWKLLDQLSGTGNGPAGTKVAKLWLDRQFRLDDPTPRAAVAADEAPPWMSVIGADRAHDDGFTGTGVRIAVVDSGIDADHPDLRGRIVAAKDFTDSDGVDDEIGHGTFVASEIAGTGAASNGRYRGVAPDSELINARVLDGYGEGTLSGILAGVEWAAQQGARIINLSLGMGGAYTDGTSFTDLFFNSVAQRYGCLIVAAVGNAGEPQSISPPATADEVLAVGATLADGTLAWFSSMGPRRGDGAVKPQIMAPGAGEASPPGDDDWYPPTTGLVGAGAGTDGYVSDDWFGTSMAAPLVAGAAALVAQAHPRLDHHGIRARLMSSAKALPDGSDVFAQGAGLVDIPAAIGQTVTASPSQLDLGGTQPPYPSAVTGAITYANTGAADEVLTLGVTESFVESEGLPDDLHGMDGPDPSARREPGGATTSARSAGAGPAGAGHATLSATRVTVPAGGTASVDLTVDASAFPEGYVGGIVTATRADGTTTRTPYGLGNQPTTYDLTVDATDVDGIPIDHSDISSGVAVVGIDVDLWDEAETADGSVTFHLLPGRYLVVGDSVKTADSDDTVETVLLSNTLDIGESTTLTLDGRRARPVTVSPGRPAEGRVAVTAVLNYDGEEVFAYGVDASIDLLAQDHLYVTPVGGAENESWSMDVAATLTQPYYQGALDGCGSTAVPLASAGEDLPSGPTRLTLVDVGATVPTAPNATAAALVRWDGDEDDWEAGFDAVTGWIQSAHTRGFRALVISSSHPSVAAYLAEDAMYFLDEPPIAVLVTDGPGGSGLRAAAQAAAGALHVLHNSTPAYVYNVAAGFDLAEDRGPYSALGRDTALAQVLVTHRTIGTETYSEDSFTVGPDGDDLSFGVEVPSSYVAYLSAGKPWRAWSLPGPSADDPSVSVVSTAPTTYAVDASGAIEFGRAVYANGFSDYSSDSDPDLISRFGDTIGGYMPLYIDGAGNLEIDRDDWDYDISTRFALKDSTAKKTLFTNDERIDHFEVSGLNPAKHTYTITETTKSGELKLSTTVKSTWTWSSAAPGDAGTGRVEPLRQVWYELPGLDAANNGAILQPVLVHVGRQAGSDTATVDKVTLRASVDRGKKWQNVELTKIEPPVSGAGGVADGESLYAGQVKATKGKLVSLNTEVSGGESALTQVIVDGYRASTASVPFPVAKSWSCATSSNIVPAPTINQVTSSAVSGTAGPNLDVTIVGPNGTSLTARADKNGSWGAKAPADGLPCGPYTATASDSAQNRSLPSPAYPHYYCAPKAQPVTAPANVKPGVGTGGSAAPDGGPAVALVGVWLMGGLAVGVRSRRRRAN